MPRPRPLPDPMAARGTLVHRLTRRADRLRQLYTRFGTRSRRVFLVWTQSTGSTRGTGSEIEIARREILPTPQVSDASSLTRRPITIDTVPEGSLRVDQVSCGAFTEDHLRGRKIPADVGQDPLRPQPESTALVRDLSDPNVPQPFDFFFEVVEDGRGDDPPTRGRYSLLSVPWRNETGMYWGFFLQPQSGARDRFGNSLRDADDVLDI